MYMYITIVQYSTCIINANVHEYIINVIMLRCVHIISNVHAYTCTCTSFLYSSTHTHTYIINAHVHVYVINM